MERPLLRSGMDLLLNCNMTAFPTSSLYEVSVQELNASRLTDAVSEPHGADTRTFIARHTYIDKVASPHSQPVQSLMRKARAVQPPVKELMSALDSHHGSIIIVGAPQLAHRLAQSSHAHIVAFSSLEELDEWRESQRGDETFRPDVVATLEEIGCSLGALP